MIKYIIKVSKDGTRFWYAYGNFLRRLVAVFDGEVLHREDGPAVEFTDGTHYWFLNGIEYSEEEFLKKLKCLN